MAINRTIIRSVVSTRAVTISLATAIATAVTRGNGVARVEVASVSASAVASLDISGLVVSGLGVFGLERSSSIHASSVDIIAIAAEALQEATVESMIPVEALSIASAVAVFDTEAVGEAGESLASVEAEVGPGQSRGRTDDGKNSEVLHVRKREDSTLDAR